MDLYSKEKRSAYNKAYYKRNKERMNKRKIQNRPDVVSEVGARKSVVGARKSVVGARKSELVPESPKVPGTTGFSSIVMGIFLSKYARKSGKIKLIGEKKISGGG